MPRLLSSGVESTLENTHKYNHKYKIEIQGKEVGIAAPGTESALESTLEKEKKPKT